MCSCALGALPRLACRAVPCQGQTNVSQGAKCIVSFPSQTCTKGACTAPQIDIYQYRFLHRAVAGWNARGQETRAERACLRHAPTGLPARLPPFHASTLLPPARYTVSSLYVRTLSNLNSVAVTGASGRLRTMRPSSRYSITPSPCSCGMGGRTRTRTLMRSPASSQKAILCAMAMVSLSLALRSRGADIPRGFQLRA